MKGIAYGSAKLPRTARRASAAGRPLALPLGIAFGLVGAITVPFLLMRYGVRPGAILPARRGLNSEEARRLASLLERFPVAMMEAAIDERRPVTRTIFL